MEKLPSQEQNKEISRQVRFRYWLDFARNQHREEMRFLLHDAKLSKKPRKVGEKWEGWNNVMKHNVAEASAMRQLCQALDMPIEEAQKQEKVAFIHDSLKHLERAPIEFTPDEKKTLEQKLSYLLDEVDPERNLINATNESFLYKVFENSKYDNPAEKVRNTPKDQIIQYYIDTIFLEDKIVSPLKRINDTEIRRQDLNEDSERTRRLGMKYWEAERVLAEQAQILIYEWLGEKKVQLSSPEEVPEFIRQKIEQSIVEYWVNANGKNNTERVGVNNESSYKIDIISDSRRENFSGNEDQAIVREENGIVLAGVFDGATTNDGLVSRNLKKTSGEVASIVAKAVLKSVPIDTKPKDALFAINQTLRDVSARLFSSGEHTEQKCTTVGLVVKQVGKKIQYANIGDTMLVSLSADGSARFVYENLCELFELAEYEAARAEAGNRNIPISEVLKDPNSKCWEVIHKNRLRENDSKSDSYGSLNGSDDGNIASYIQSGELELKDGERVLLLTDGLSLPVSVSVEERLNFIASAIKNRGITGLLEQIRSVELGNPDCDNPLRLKKHDDATGILLAIK